MSRYTKFYKQYSQYVDEYSNDQRSVNDDFVDEVREVIRDQQVEPKVAIKIIIDNTKKETNQNDS